MLKELALLGANFILLAKNEKRLDEIYDDIKENTQSKPLIINCNLEKLDEEKSQEIANVIAKEYNVLDYVIHYLQCKQFLHSQLLLQIRHQ